MAPRSRTIPILPCRSLDDALPFYEALGFARTYRQDRPNPYAVVELDDICIHLFGMELFDPADSYGNAGIEVADPDALYRSFAAGLRHAYGKLPAAGIPRILRPRKKQGVTYGFTIVDPGGNWLRISTLDATTDADDGDNEPASRLARAIDNAARQGDSHGDESRAIRILTNGLARHPEAPAIERCRALLYRAELAARTGDLTLARASFADAAALPLEKEERQLLADEFTHSAQLIDESNQDPDR